MQINTLKHILITNDNSWCYCSFSFIWLFFKCSRRDWHFISITRSPILNLSITSWSRYHVVCKFVSTILGKWHSLSFELWIVIAIVTWARLWFFVLNWSNVIPLTNGYSFDCLFRIIVISRSRSCFNFIISTFVYTILWTFINCCSFFILARTWNIFWVSFIKFLTNGET